MAYSLTSFPNLSIIFPILLHNPLNVIWITTSFNYMYLSMRVHTSHWCYKCPPFTLHPWCNLWHFCYHCTRCCLPCGLKQLHTLPSITFHSFYQRGDIWLTKDGIHTLVDVVIVDPTWIDLFCWSYITWGFVTFEATQAKEKGHCDQHPINHFVPLAIKVLGCLDKQVNVFLHDYANVMWNFKGPESPLLFVLVIFLCKKILITLQGL